MMYPNALITSITAMASLISEGRTDEEIELLAVVFTQLGDTLATILTAREHTSKTDIKKIPNIKSNM